MELLGAIVLLALLGLLAGRFGYDSRPGLDSKESTLAARGMRWTDLGDGERSAAGDRPPVAVCGGAQRRGVRRGGARSWRAVKWGQEPGRTEARQDGPPNGGRSTAMRLDEAAFGAVGLRLDSVRARALAVALGEAADAARTAGEGGWAWGAVERVLGALERAELVGLVGDLGLVGITVDGETADDPVCDILRHLLRDRLVDVLRVGAGQPPFWSWEAVAPAAPVEADALAA